MALTVEELQIVLSCDATTAQAVLDKMEATVKAYTDKFQKYFNNMGGKKNNSVPTLDNVVKDVKRQTKNLSKYGADWKKQYEKTFGETFDSSMMKAKIRAAAARPRYASSGEKYVGRGGGMGDPDYFKNSAAYKATFSKQATNENVLELGAKVRATLEDSLGKVNSISDAMRSKIADAIQKVKQLGAEYTKAVEAGGNDSKASNAALEKFKKAIYAADQYIQKLDKVAAKEQETGTDSSEEKRVSMFSRIAAAASAAGNKIASIGQAVKKAFQSSILSKFLKQLSRTIMRMAAMKLIRGTLDSIKQGLEMLGRAGGTAGKAMNQVKAAGQSVKAALGVALMPVVKALAPVFYQVAQAVTAAGNAIARFLATLLGQSSYTAAAITSSMDDVSSSYGGAGKAAKNALADFDEINLITKSSGGGGGGAGGDTGLSTISEELVGAGNGFAEQLREAFLGGDWSGLGSLLSGKLGNISKKITEFLKRPEIQNFGKNLADALNGSVSDPKNWENFGEAVGTFLNTIIKNIADFFKTVKWVDVINALESFWKGFKTAFESSGKASLKFEKPFWKVILDWLFPDGWATGDAPKETTELGTWVQENLIDPIMKPIDEWIQGLDVSLGGIGEKIFGGVGNDIEISFLKYIKIPLQESILGYNKWITEHPILAAAMGYDVKAISKEIDGLSESLDHSKQELEKAEYAQAQYRLEQGQSLTVAQEMLLGIRDQTGALTEYGREIKGVTDSTRDQKNATDQLQGSLDKLGETNVEPQVNPKVGETIETNDLFSDRPITHGKKIGEGSAKIDVGLDSKIDKTVDSTDVFSNKAGVIHSPTGMVIGLGMRPEVQGPIKSTDLLANSSGVAQDKNGLGIPFKVRPEVEGGNTTVTALQSIITGFNDISGKAKKATLSVKMSGAKESAVTKMSNAVSKFFDGSKTSTITINQDGASLTQIENAANAIKNFPKSVTVQATIDVVNAAALKKALQDALTASAKITVNGNNAGSFKVNAKNVQTMASGGIAYGITSAIIGEYAGASSNPEVVAPLSKLQGILESSGTVSKDTMTRDQANTMIQLLQRIERKEIEVKPSVGLGQVVQQSLGAYART